MGALRNAVVDGDIETGSLMAGQSVGLVKQVMSVKDIIAELIENADKEICKLKELLNS